MFQTQQCISVIITLYNFMSIKESKKRQEEESKKLLFIELVILTFFSIIPGTLHLYLIF